jgi:hypothetical protein
MDINPKILKSIDVEADGNVIIIDLLRELIEYEVQDPVHFKEYYAYKIDESLSKVEE